MTLVHEQLLRIREEAARPWSPPEPADKEYVAFVKEEVRLAGERALKILRGEDLPEGVYRELKLLARRLPKRKVGRVVLKVRPHPTDESVVARGDPWGEGRCARCGCLWDRQTPGCSICSLRHRQRASAPKEPKERRCRGCNCLMDESVVGCNNCVERHRMRNRKLQAQSATTRLLRENEAKRRLAR